MPVPYVIALSGKLGSGKDYIAKYVVEKVLKKAGINYLPVAFADQIKVNAMSKNRVNYTDVYVKKTEETRRLLQREGMVGRQSDSECWIKYLDNWIRVWEHKGIQLFVITDLRFKNELEYITNRFQHRNILIKVVAEDRTAKKALEESGGNKEIFERITKHHSETDLDSLEDSFDFVVDNSESIVNEFNLKRLEDSLAQILSLTQF